MSWRCKAAAVKFSLFSAPNACSGFAMCRANQSPRAACRSIPSLLHIACLALTLCACRCRLGLLYLRYVGEPKSLWQDWLSHYMYDDQVRQSESLW